MKREEAKNILFTKEPSFLEVARQTIAGKPSYVCPVCGNGSGKDGSGIAFVPGTEEHPRWKCFKCADGRAEDIIGLWKLHTQQEDNAAAFSSLYRYFGIDADGKTSAGALDTKSKPKVNVSQQAAASTKEKQLEDKRAYFKECEKRISETDYPQRRGLSPETVAKYHLGFATHFKGNKGRIWKGALIIPKGNYSYVARNTDQQAEHGQRYHISGNSQLFNSKRALAQKEQPVFIVEGELDALSILEVGKQAIGLSSTGNAKKLLEKLKDSKPEKPLILALDNDDAGQMATKVLTEGLREQGIFYSIAKDLYGENKDANDCLLADRAAFIESLKKAEEDALGEQAEEVAAQREEYLKTSTASHIQKFIDGIANSVNTPYIPTGFKQLDAVLDGGLYEGLYIIGAISSLGKTTLALQIADQIAQKGKDVLIFSLEMGRTELMAKSISRLTLLLDAAHGKNAKTTRQITTGSRYEGYSETEKALINQAVTAYAGFAGNIFIYEGIGDIGVAKVRSTVEKHLFFTGQKPVVLVDYVQILAPSDIRATDKQNTDKAVLELKRLSRDFKIPVIGISSVNRASYNTPAKMEMLKESGSLEFGSDVVLGLQLRGVGGAGFDVDKAKQSNPREIELVVLKNRNGATGGTLRFSYYPLFNYFTEF
jgi:replicative DNA helicase